MMQYWVLFTLSWLSSVRPQYITTGGPQANIFGPAESSLSLPIPYTSYYDFPIARNEYESDPSNKDNSRFYQQQYNEPGPDLQRKRRTIDTKALDQNWVPNLVDTDKTIYLRTEDDASPYQHKKLAGEVERNNTVDIQNILDILEQKRSFSPWGGKRNQPLLERTWSWRREANIKEPSMPKRVRFSPWGGKRSGHINIPTGSKASSKIIFTASGPEVTHIMSGYSPNENKFNLEEFRIIPFLAQRPPIKVLALRSNLDRRPPRGATAFTNVFDALPRIFKLGHPYADVNLKKDGKRKVKFSAWGGKRSPPIIGPVWTQASQKIKDSTLEAILLIRNSQLKDKMT